MKNNLICSEDANNPDLISYLDSLSKAKDNAQLNKDEKLANSYWAEIEAINVNILFIEAFDNLKNKNYRRSWELLERCEINCKFIIMNSEVEFQERKRILYIEETIKKLQSLYPYCVFVSPGFTVSYYSCGICGHKIKPRSRCDHKKGKLYNGKLCLHEGHGMEFLEISIVSKPVQKYSVLHDDSTLDFSILEYLINILDYPFEQWSFEKTRMAFPREKFDLLSGKDKCPCQSGSLFKSCCFEKDDIEIPHIDFFFSKEIPNHTEEIRFPY